MTQPMNRQTKRMAKRMGVADDEGKPTQQPRSSRPKSSGHKRTGPITFFRQVMAELRKVSWPTRSEVLNYTFVTILCLFTVGAFIFVLDYVFLRWANALYK